jgi:Tfp pilus assembly protein PilN
MVRINLLAERAGVAELPRQTVLPLWVPVAVLSIGAATGVLWWDWQRSQHELVALQARLAGMRAELARMESLRRQVAQFEQQKATMERQLDQIARLEQNRVDAEYLLEAVAATVARSPRLRLTTLTRKQSGVHFQGQAASLDSIAGFMAQLRRSGAFEQVTLKQAEQQAVGSEPAIFQFELQAQFQRPLGTAGAMAGGRP